MNKLLDEEGIVALRDLIKAAVAAKTPTHDYSLDYFTTECIDACKFGWTANGQTVANEIEYMVEGGEWALLNIEDTTEEFPEGTKVYWRALTNKKNGTFGSTGRFKISGNLASLAYGDDFAGHTELTGNNGRFKWIFAGNSTLINAQNLVIPFDTLSVTYAFQGAFQDCVNMIHGPKELPATTLSLNCYQDMFYGCTNLQDTPEILPAMTLTLNCYNRMYKSCSSIVRAPELPSVTLITGCYKLMFRNCVGLRWVKAMFMTIPSTDYTVDWLQNVNSNGTFVKNSDASWADRGNYAVPDYWTIETVSE